MKQNFQKDLKFGQSKELEFCNLFPGKLKQTDGRKGDLLIIKTNQKIELKTERRASTETNNIFVELHSHHVNKTDGGPVQAFKAGCSHIVWQFADGVVLVYEIRAFLTRFSKLVKMGFFKMKIISFSNASGYALPIKEFQDICLRMEDIL